LGLEMRLLPDGRLRFFDPRTGEYLRTHREERERANREHQARLEAETQLEAMRKLLRDRSINPDKLN